MIKKEHTKNFIVVRSKYDLRPLPGVLHSGIFTIKIVLLLPPSARRRSLYKPPFHQPGVAEYQTLFSPSWRRQRTFSFFSLLEKAENLEVTDADEPFPWRSSLKSFSGHRRSKMQQAWSNRVISLTPLLPHKAHLLLPLSTLKNFSRVFSLGIPL
ncbi:hypothetical protein KFK09_002473 [Dendrobium nobile]|uniref:Uncharacterized protein n=1 Tax=Dendrobium nobile TaxID=94219 RepID=A0A8T3C6I3_DENNO|nr:hypothetical protein KFK09_017719 [Dendrobium nobile]KAI0526880.1 hypothetical protein KFK09_002473 [Dendrobium nobile]